jgi:DNA-binding response OmpR family regulator
MSNQTRRSGGRCRILVVDDDTYVAEFFGAFFDPEGYEVRVTADVIAGREEVKKGEYEVLFLDVYLPGTNGLEVLKEILKEVEMAVDMGKVVVITGEVTKGLRRRAEALGVQRCLGKPFDLAEIREIVESSRVGNGAKPGACNGNETTATKRLQAGG